MRQIKFKRSRRSNKQIMYWIFFLVFIPIVAIFLGSKITQKFVVPVFYPNLPNLSPDKVVNITKETESGEENTKGNGEYHGDQEITLGGFSIYLIQIASFTSPNNIETLVEDLNKGKLPHIIHKMDDGYKIYVFGSTNRKSIEERLPLVRKYYPDAYINELYYLDKNIILTGEKTEISQEIIKDINSIMEIMDKQAEEWYNFIGDDEKLNLNAYKKLLEEHQIIVTRLLKTDPSISFPKGLPQWRDIERMLFHHEKNIKHSLKLIDEGGEIYKIHSLFLDSLFMILETIR